MVFRPGSTMDKHAGVMARKVIAQLRCFRGAAVNYVHCLCHPSLMALAAAHSETPVHDEEGGHEGWRGLCPFCASVPCSSPHCSTPKHVVCFVRTPKDISLGQGTQPVCLGLCAKASPCQQCLCHFCIFQNFGAVRTTMLEL